MNLSDDILEYLLTEHFSYRTQYTLTQVCAQWYRIIMKIPPDWDRIVSSTVAKIYEIREKCNNWHQILSITYTLLLRSELRPFFINPNERSTRNIIIMKCYRCYIPHKPSSPALERLCHRIDDITDILMHKSRYWYQVRGQNRDPYDIDHDEMAQSFDIN